MAAANSTYKKLAVQWLNEALCFVSSSVQADSFVVVQSSVFLINNYVENRNLPQARKHSARVAALILQNGTEASISV